MIVGDVIKLAAQLSVELDSPTSDMKDIYLSYLNLAHFELYKKVASVNTIAPIQRDILAVTDGIVDPFTQPVFNIRSVYRKDINRQLQPNSFDKIQEIDPANIETGDPAYWYYNNNTLNIWPLFTQDTDNGGGIGVVYNIQPVQFGLNDDLSTYYPAAYHPVLADGTCYYIFQGEAGFKSDFRMQASLARWELGKTNMFNYMLMAGGKNIYSTYSRR